MTACIGGQADQWCPKQGLHSTRTRGEQVKVKLSLDLLRPHVDDDGMACVVATSAASADIHLSAENVGKLACNDPRAPSRFVRLTATAKPSSPRYAPLPSSPH